MNNSQEIEIFYHNHSIKRFYAACKISSRLFSYPLPSPMSRKYGVIPAEIPYPCTPAF